MKIYVAAPWIHKPEAIKVGDQLIAAGFEITSRWFNHQGTATDSAGLTAPLEHIQVQALEDIEDVKKADLLIILNLCKSEGKAVETGIAIANKIPIISIGPRGNIFQTLGREMNSVEDAIAYLRQ